MVQARAEVVGHSVGKPSFSEHLLGQLSQGPRRKRGKPGPPSQGLHQQTEGVTINQSLEDVAEGEVQGTRGPVRGEPTYSAQVKGNPTPHIS